MTASPLSIIFKIEIIIIKQNSQKNLLCMDTMEKKSLILTETELIKQDKMRFSVSVKIIKHFTYSSRWSIIWYMLACTKEHSFLSASTVILVFLFGYHSQIMPHRTPPNPQLIGIYFLLSNLNCCNLLFPSFGPSHLIPCHFRGSIADGTSNLSNVPPDKVYIWKQTSLEHRQI